MAGAGDTEVGDLAVGGIWAAEVGAMAEGDILEKCITGGQHFGGGVGYYRGGGVGLYCGPRGFYRGYGYGLGFGFGGYELGLGLGYGLGYGFGGYGGGYGYGPPYYPYSPVVAVPAAPQVYIQRQDMSPQDDIQRSVQLPANYWYYCRAPAGYYPYVNNCIGSST